MPTELNRIPPVTVPDDLYELLRFYAYREKLSLSGAVRDLLKKSPELVELAGEQGVDLQDMAVREWGGNRKAEIRERDRSEMRQLDKIGGLLADRSQTVETQSIAIKNLIQAKLSHRRHVGSLLQRALLAHWDGYGPIQKQIIEALGEVGYVDSIPDIMTFQGTTEDPDVRAAIEATLEKLMKKSRERVEFRRKYPRPKV